MTIDIFNTENKYDLILADPPWKQSKGVLRRPSATKLEYPQKCFFCLVYE